MIYHPPFCLGFGTCPFKTSYVENCLAAGLRVVSYTMDGKLAGRYSGYDNALGARAFGWSRPGKALAVGAYDQSVRVMNQVASEHLAELDHPAVLEGPPSVRNVGARGMHA